MDGEVRDNNVPFRWSAALAAQIEGVGWRFQRRATHANNRWMDRGDFECLPAAEFRGSKE
jgi:hypothetical protein